MDIARACLIGRLFNRWTAGLMSAQRYPGTSTASSPARRYNQIYLSAWRMRLLMTALKSSQHALPLRKLKLLNDAVLDKCDSNDGR